MDGDKEIEVPVESKTAADIFVEFLRRPLKELDRDCEPIQISRGIQQLLDRVNEEGTETVLSEKENYQLEMVRAGIKDLKVVTPGAQIIPIRQRTIEIWETALSKRDLDSVLIDIIPKNVLRLIDQRIERFYAGYSKLKGEDFRLARLLRSYNLSISSRFMTAICHRLIKAALCEHYLVAQKVPVSVFEKHDQLVRDLIDNCSQAGVGYPERLIDLQEFDPTEVKFIDIRRLKTSGNANLEIAAVLNFDPPFLRGVEGAAHTLFHERLHRILDKSITIGDIEAMSKLLTIKEIEIEKAPSYDEIFVATLAAFASNPSLDKLPRYAQDNYEEGVLYFKTLLDRIGEEKGEPNYGLQLFLRRTLTRREEETGQGIYEPIKEMYDLLCAKKYGKTFDQEMVLYSDAAYTVDLGKKENRERLYLAREISEEDRKVYEAVAEEWGGGLLFVQPREVFEEAKRMIEKKLEKEKRIYS